MAKPRFAFEASGVPLPGIAVRARQPLAIPFVQGEVTARFECPYLGEPVDLTEERRRHILARHPEAFGDLTHALAVVLLRPDFVIQSRSGEHARIFARGYPRGARVLHAVVVVLIDPSRGRRWIVTSYVARDLPKGTIEWQRI